MCSGAVIKGGPCNGVAEQKLAARLGAVLQAMHGATVMCPPCIRARLHTRAQNPAATLTIRGDVGPALVLCQGDNVEIESRHGAPPQRALHLQL